MVALFAAIAAIAASDVLVAVGFALWVSAVIVTDALVTRSFGRDEDGER